MIFVGALGKGKGRRNQTGNFAEENLAKLIPRGSPIAACWQSTLKRGETSVSLALYPGLGLFVRQRLCRFERIWGDRLVMDTSATSYVRTDLNYDKLNTGLNQHIK